MLDADAWLEVVGLHVYRLNEMGARQPKACGTGAAIAERLSRHLRDEVPPGLVAAYLFGSQARDAAHRDSDVDIGLLFSWDAVPSPAQRFERRIRLTGEIGHALGRNDVDVVVLNEAPPHLARHIVTEGKRVYCSDADATRAFVRDVQLRAADLAPFLRRMRRIKLEALAR